MKQLMTIALLLLTVVASAQIPINTNFQVSTPNPIDGRMTIVTLSDTSTITDLYDGLLTVVQDTDEIWQYDGGKWVQFSGGGTDDQTAAEVAYTNNGQSNVEGGLDSLFSTIEAVTQELGASAIQSISNYEGQNLFKENGTTTGNELLDYTTGVRIPVAQNWKLTDTVAIPNGFTAPVPFKIWRKGDGAYGTEYDDINIWRDSFFISGLEGVYYVDPISGSDLNNGLTKATAFENYSTAINRTDATTIYLKGTIHDSKNGDLTPPNADTIQLISYDGRAELVDFKPAIWTETTLAGVWKSTVSDTVDVVLDFERRGELGQRLLLENTNADTVRLSNTPNAYCYVGDTMYVHTSDGTAPSPYRNVVIEESDSKNFTTSHNYIENVDFYGRISWASQAGDNTYARDCGIFQYPISLVDQSRVNGGATAYFYGLRYGYCATDAIDYDDLGTVAYEINCIGRNAGADASGSDNQLSTAHGGAKVVTINADYQGASNQIIYDVNDDTQRWILGGLFSGTLNKDGSSTTALRIGALSTDTSKMWAESVKIGGDFDFHFGATGGDLYLRNTNINSTTKFDIINNGTIQKY